jgi:outer membrane protein TolC
MSFNRNQAPPNGFTPALRIDTLSTDANVVVPLQTGGSFRFDYPLQRIDGTNGPPILNPNYLTTPNFSFSQPLLRGFGFYVAGQGIRIAFYQYQQSQAAAKLEVTNVLSNVDRAYWQLYLARQLLDVRRTQYNSAAAQLERARREARAGVIAEVDIVRAESGVADQVEQILLAENNVRQQERNLKGILNKPGLDVDSPTRLLTATPPNLTTFMLDRDRLTRAALGGRMELLQTEIQIAAETANVRVARNGLLPLLSFQYTLGLNGTGRDFGRASNQSWGKDYETHTFGLQLQVPIGNEAARSQLRRAMLARLQQLATRDQQVLQVRQDVLAAADNFETDWQRILAGRKRVELAQRDLDVEVHQFEQGLRTSTDVLIAQANLADAQSSAVTAVSDYQTAQVDLAYSTGTTLGALGVTWQPMTLANRGNRESK